MPAPVVLHPGPCVSCSFVILHLASVMSFPVFAGKGGTYWGPRYYWLFIFNLFNTYPCYPQHKLANDHVACNKLFVKTARLLAKQDPDAGSQLGVAAQPDTKIAHGA